MLLLLLLLLLLLSSSSLSVVVVFHYFNAFLIWVFSQGGPGLRTLSKENFEDIWFYVTQAPLSSVFPCHHQTPDQQLKGALVASDLPSYPPLTVQGAKQPDTDQTWSGFRIYSSGHYGGCGFLLFFNVAASIYYSGHVCGLARD